MTKRLFPMALAFAALAFSGNLAAQAPNVTATKSDGTPATTKKNPGDTVTYTNVITNTGTANANGVNFTDPDVNGSVVQMSTLKVSPLAFDDNYSGTILSGVTVNTATATNFSVTANDYVGIYNNAAGVLTITAFDATSANGGTVSMTTSGANIGKFIYTSAAGFTGVDSFTYTISNTGFTSTATVTVTVSGPGIFFVSDSTGDDTNGKGTLTSPYKTLTKVATLDANTSQRIFVFSGAYTAGMTMEANEQIFGQGVRGVSFDSVVAGLAAGADSVARPLINGTLPTITAASGSVITLAQNNTIRGVSINSTVAGYAVTGSAINSLQLGSSGGSTASDTSVTASSASSGCLNLSGGGNGSVNILALLANSASAGRSLTVSGRTGGTTSVIGKLTDTGAGVSLSGNTGATFNFRSFALATGANTAFSATGGGTVNATQGESDGIDNDGDTSTDEADEANIINNVTGGTGVNIANTSIGASNFIIRSLTSTGGTSPGINLNTTGNSGGLFVTGDSGGTNNASGGSITNKTGSTLTTGTPGVVAVSTTNLRLSYMNITGCNHSGIYGSTVNGFVLSRCNVNTNGNDIVSNPDETGVDITNLTGTAIAGSNPTAINFCVIQNNKEFELQINNTTGTLTDFQVNSSTIASNNADTLNPHGNLFNFLASDTANMTANVANCTFTGNAKTPGGTTATAVHVDVGGTGVMTANVSGCTITDNNVGVSVSASGAGTLTFDVHDNPAVTVNRSHGLNCFLAADATGLINGKFRNNVVGTLGTIGSGSDTGFGVRIQNEAIGSANAANFSVTGNTIQETASFNLFNLNTGLATIASTKTTNVTITGNTFRNSAARAITIQQNNATNGTSAGIIHAHVSSNTFSGIAGQAADGTEIRFRQLAANGGTFRSTQTDVNNLASVNSLTLADLSIGGTISYNQGLPTAPPLLFAPGGVEKAAASISSVFASALPAASVKSSQIQPDPTQSSLENVNQVVSQAPPAEIAKLAQADLETMVSSALALWKASGLTPEQEEHLRSLTFEVSSLDGIRLGEADGHIIRIDADAGGSGWYVDASDKHFKASSATRFSTSPSAAPAGRLDLLTAILHEMGHTLGLEDSYLEKDRDSLMYGFLTLGERRLPAKRQAFGARSHGHKHGETHFLTGAVNIGVLPPGKSVTISYDVIIDNPATTTSLSSQATVSGSNFSNVLTDDLVSGGDPLLPGAADPTVTLINLPDVSVAVSPASVLEDSGDTITFTFTREAPTTSAMTVNFSAVGSGADLATDFTVASGTGTATYTPATGLGTIVIPIGSTTATMVVTPVSDIQVEASESVVINVAAGTSYDIGIPASASSTITNDDTGVRVNALPDAALFEDQVINFAYTFQRIGVTTGTITVNFSVGGTATFSTDYTQSGASTFSTTSGTVVFGPGETTKVVTLDPTNDNLVEGNETITLAATSGSGYIVLAPSNQTGTIVDDDVNVALTSVVPSSSVEDSGTGMVYTFTRSGGSVANALTANVTVSGTAGLTGDYATLGFSTFNTGTGAATIVFSGGATTKTVTITPSSDVTGEPDETVILTVAPNGTPAVTGGYSPASSPNDTATGTIVNDDTQVSVAVTPSPVGESSGTPMVYTFTRTGSTAAAQVVNFSIGGTATNTTDYTAASSGTFTYTPPTGTITIPIGQSTATLSVTPATDAIVEANETVVLTVTAGAGYVPAAGPDNVATGTITDDDVATVSIAKIQDGNEGPPLVNGKFRITQTAVSSTNTVVNYNITGTATPGAGNDYATLSGTATILAGNTTVDIDVIVQADAGSEGPETVIVNFSTFGAHDADITFGSPTTATVTIFSSTIITGTWMGTPLINTSGAFDCTGLTLDIDLGFVPVIGTPYTLVHADGGVTGNFNDLPQNGVIALSINGVIYYFQATYGPTDVILTPFTPSGPAEWTWVSGPSSRNGVGVYGSLGVAAPTNNPGARQGAMNWYSPDGSLWMFGGYGYATAVTNPPRYLNDIWQYDRALGRWIWQGGANTFNSPGTYGTIGVEAPGNAPGGRHTGTTWTDADGDLWLFGGYGIGASGAPAWLNDLWRFDRTSKQWTHMKGSTATGGAATYGVQGTPAAGNTPGARSSATGFFRDGNLWLFGGYNGTSYYNDLWRYEIATGNWAWMEGSNTANQNGVYGVQGTPNGTNTPGSRRDATGWTASDGTLWLFGGLGLPASGATAGDMSDLWRYNPTTGDWTWIKGVNTLNAVGVYGTQNTPAPGNLPSARSAGSGWITVDGDLWLVGGFKNSGLTYDDVWIYDIGSNQWTWKLGSAGLLNQPGVYGTQGTAAPANKPGGRFTPSTWVTLNGSLWIFGGGGADAFGNTGRMSDLWRYAIPKPAGATYDEGMPEAFPSDLIVNGDPNASDATAGTMAYVPVSGKLTGTDPDGDRLLFSSAGATTLSQGTLTLNKDGAWTYTPAYGFTGVASFQFKAADNYGGESSVKSLVISVITNPADSDGDGIADAYEQSTWGSLAAADGDGDADLDGQSNYFEFLAGTNPLDGNETLSTSPTVTGTTSANGHVQLQLNHVRPGVNYHLETSSDLDAWTRLGTFTFDVSGSATVEDPTPSTGAPKFYRMSLEATPAIVVP